MNRSSSLHSLNKMHQGDIRYLFVMRHSQHFLIKLLRLHDTIIVKIELQVGSDLIRHSIQQPSNLILSFKGND